MTSWLENHRHGVICVLMNGLMHHPALAALVAISVLVSATPSPAQDNGRGDVDEVIQGFEDESTGGTEIPLAEDEILEGFEDGAGNGSLSRSSGKEPTPWSLNGESAITTTYSFSASAVPPWRDLTMLRGELDLAAKYRFSDGWRGRVSAGGFYDLNYVLRQRSEYAPEVLNAYESGLELKDAFVEGSLTDRLDIKIGRQVVVWGSLDSLRVTDVLNPVDLRFPGLADIEDLRLPVTIVRFSYYVGSWSLSGIALPEVRFSKLPAYGSDFFPSTEPLPPEVVPDDGLGEMQYAASLTGVFSGWDIGFHWADVFSDQTYAQLVSPGPPPQFLRKHPRVRMLAAAANLARGNWLLKAEAAWFGGLRFSNTPGLEHSRFDLGGGVEYAGLSKATIRLEAVNRHTADYDSQLELPPDETREDEFQWALRYTREFMNDTLTVNLLTSAAGIRADEGAFERLDVEYEVTDDVSVRVGVVLYQSGDKGLLKNVDANDRLFAVVRYNF